MEWSHLVGMELIDSIPFPPTKCVALLHATSIVRLLPWTLSPTLRVRRTMAGVLEEAWFPYRALVAVEEESVVSSNPTDAVAFVAISLVLGIACRHLLRGTRVPYTVALLIIGVGLGSLEHGTSRRLGRIGNGIRLWENIDPDLLLAVFLPALLFESSFSMEMHQIKKCMAHMILLAGPGVVISTFVLGSALKYTFPYNWSWKISLLLGGLLSATDPVAVVALLKELGASKKLNTIIEGESLMNDGTAIVIYQLFFRMVVGQNLNSGTAVKYLTQASFGAVGIGVAFAIASVWWLQHIFNDTVIEFMLTLAVSYLAYFTGQECADVSGVLTVMALGMFYALVARRAFKGDSIKSLHHFWEMVSYFANTLIFILSGVVIAEGVLSSANILEDHGNSWGYLILLYVFVQVSRIVVVGMLYPFLQYFGYGLNWKEGVIIVWSGLRGAVALSLSLSVKHSSYGSSYLSSETGTLFVFFTGGIVFLTLIVNGSTTQFILHVLGMNKLSAAKRQVLDYTKYEMQRRALYAFVDLGDDEELGPADWRTVKKYISTLNNVEETQLHPHSVSECRINLDHMNLKDTRKHLLNGVRAAYWEMFNEGRVGQTTANLLIQSVDEAIDLVPEEPLCDWKGLKSNVGFPGYYKFLQRSIFPEKLISYFAVERLESACCMCAAFLRAHRIARKQLYDFIGESEISSAVIHESNTEGEEPRRFLEDVRLEFPQVLCAVKTRQVTYSMLKHLIDYIQSLESVGLLEEKEMVHLHDAIQMDLKKLLGNPPLVKIARRGELISCHPLFGALPSRFHAPLEGLTKEFMEQQGTILYKEGSNPKGIWLISNGVVKWTSETSRHKHSLHPIFLHGSTLGMYEVLSEKPYICDMITDSQAQCFFVKIDKKMLSLLRSDSEVEEFLWQESVIVLAKLLLPPIFEIMTMWDLRALVDTSRMIMYIHAESIEIPHHSIGFLLEGYIKSQGVAQELITSPAVLLPTYGTQSSQNLETSGSSAGSFIYHGSQYIADSRARVIVFNMAAHEVESAIQRRKSSFLLLNSADHPPRSRRREHIGLMSGPELAYNQTQHNWNSEYTGSGTKNMSAKAMQLSIFGCMVSDHPDPRNVPPRIRDKPSHSKSYPRVPSNQAPPLVSIQSEGSSTLRSLTLRSFTQPTLCPDTQLILDHSSDESGSEDEHIMCIDSPSNISFHQVS